MSDGIASNTAKQYSTGQRHYLNFCAQLGVVPCPATELLLLRFVASFNNSVRGNTVQNYLSAIRHLHVMNGVQNPIPEFERLKLVVKSLKKKSGPPRQRSPISISMLKAICATLNLRMYNEVLFWAMTVSGFFGFLRVSEFTVSGEFDPVHHLCRQDLSLAADFSTCYLQIKTSKTDPFRRGCRIVLGATGDAVCPVLAILLYLSRRTQTVGPLFKFANGRPATRNWFCHRLKEAICAIGFQGDFTSHSLRIGAATTAAAVGIPHATIQTLGRWTSDSYKLYLRMSDQQKKESCRRLVSAR